jgi:small-conductance mechanosensitive channel/CRP-like cAMP-binding protein
VWSRELWLVGQIVLLFLALSFLYWVIFKRIQWRSALARALTERVRVWAYLLIPLIPFAWGTRQSAFVVPEAARFAENLRWFAESVLLVVLGILLVEASSVFVFDYFFAVQRRIDAPQILRSLARGIVYVLLFFFFFPRLFGWRDVAGLLTSSAIVSIIIGLALQETLGNLFAGISMQMSRPYTAGHWVKIGAYEGVVERADWRSMTMRTLSGDWISFPHSLLAKMEIHNYSLPSPLHARTVQVGVHYRHPPSKVEEILLQCTRGTPGVCAQPLPEVWLSAYQDFAILYTVKFWIEDFARHPAIESEVMRRIWYHFRRERIRIPFPIREVYHHTEDASADTRSDDVRILKDIEFLQVLTNGQLQALAERLETQIFARGEVICRQGEPGETFYIIKKGQVEVAAHDGQGGVTFKRTIGPGEFFGEISLMTGEPRNATVTAVEETAVLTIGKEDMRHLLEENSQLADHVSHVLVLRLQQLEEQRLLHAQFTSQTVAAQERRAESLRREFLVRMRNFFSY